MGINSDMLDNYDFTGNDYTSYDFDQPAYDLGDYPIELSPEVTDFDLNDYFDFDDATWNTEYDEMFSFDSEIDSLYGAEEGEEYTPALFGGDEVAAEEEGSINLDAGKKGFEDSKKDPLEMDEDIKAITGDERETAGEKARNTLYGDDRELRDRFENGEEVTINGKTYVYNPLTGKAEQKTGSSWFKNEGLLKMLGGIGGAGLGFIGKSSETEMMKDMWNDKMTLAREDRQHDKDMYDLKMSYKRGTGAGGAKSDRSAALAGLNSGSRKGDFTKR